MNKNPIVAALLNFFFFGAGTLYVGRRMLPALAMMLGGTAVQLVEIKLSPPLDNAVPTVWPFFFAGLFLLKVGLAIDGYREARQVSRGAAAAA